jgi:hypothetical protein
MPRKPKSKALGLQLAEVVLRQGELRLGAQLEVALASDQRAILAATILAGIATAVIGFGIAWLASFHYPLGWGAIVCGLSFLVSAGLCSYAARPIGFALVGNLPENWWRNAVTQRPLAACLKKESGNYQKMIKYNKGVLATNAKHLSNATKLAIAAPVFGLVVWVVLVSAHLGWTESVLVESVSSHNHHRALALESPESNLMNDPRGENHLGEAETWLLDSCEG